MLEKKSVKILTQDTAFTCISKMHTATTATSNHSPVVDINHSFSIRITEVRFMRRTVMNLMERQTRFGSITHLHILESLLSKQRMQP